MTGAEMVLHFEQAGIRRTEITVEMVRAFDIGVRAEREPCANVAESHEWTYDEEPIAMRAIAAAIRARGKE